MNFPHSPLAVTVPGVDVLADISPAYAEIVTAPALAFVAGLSRQFENRRRALWRSAPSARPSSTPASCPISCPRPERSARATGRSRRCPPTCRTAASRSPARSTARWSSTR